MLPHPQSVRRTARSEGGLLHRSATREGGFTLVEFLIATLIMALVLGSAVALSMQIQQAYGSEPDNAAEQEARYALDWIVRDLRSAGSDPYFAIDDDEQVWLDPDGGDDNDDSICVEADIHDDDGLAGPGDPDGPDGDIDDAGEIVRIALVRDPVTGIGTINRLEGSCVDPGLGVAMTEPIFTDLSFTWLDTDKNETDVSKLVAYVRVEVTAQLTGRSQSAEEERRTSVLSTEVRLRTR
jgi:hypothetical protein